MYVALELPYLPTVRVQLQRPVQRIHRLAVPSLGGEGAPAVHVERRVGRIALGGMVERGQRPHRVAAHQQSASLVVQHDQVRGVELPPLVERLRRLGILFQLHQRQAQAVQHRAVIGIGPQRILVLGSGIVHSAQGGERVAAIDVRGLAERIDLKQHVANGDDLLMIALGDERLLLPLQHLHVPRLVVKDAIVSPDGVVVPADIAERGGLVHEGPLVPRFELQDLVGHGDELFRFPHGLEGGHLRFEHIDFLRTEGERLVERVDGLGMHADP